MKKVLVGLVILLGSACAHRIVIPPVVDNRLPHWEDAMSDGCSTVFSLVRGRLFDVDIKLNTLTFSPAETACCVVHDHRYYDGGSAEDRQRADLELRQCLRGAGEGIVGRIEARIRADAAYQAVRDQGGPEGRISGVSWANGPRLQPAFSYTDHPKEEKP